MASTQRKEGSENRRLKHGAIFDQNGDCTDLSKCRNAGSIVLRLEYAGRSILFTGDAVGRADCCHVCRTSRACGDSCISASHSCNQPQGCACDLANVCP